MSVILLLLHFSFVQYIAFTTPRCNIQTALNQSRIPINLVIFYLRCFFLFLVPEFEKDQRREEWLVFAK